MTRSGWVNTPIKFLVSLNDDVLPETFPATAEIHYVEISDVSEATGITWHDSISFGEAPSRARRRIRDGDVLVSTVRTYLRAVAGVDNARDKAVASTGFAVLRPKHIHSGFLEYAMLNSAVLDEVVARSVGVSYPAINASDLIAIKIPAPDFREQEEVATFLDRETAEIDAFIADHEELIGLLAERRAATIGHAVTKGLDPSVAMKDSGVEWLADVPVHWAVGQLKNLCELALGKMLEPLESLDASLQLPYMRAANVQPLGVVDLSSAKEMWFTPNEARRLTLRRGDVVVVEGGVGGYGRAAYLPMDLDGWAFQNSIIRVRPGAAKGDGRFIAFALLHLRKVGYIEMAASVTSMPHFTLDKVEKTVIAWPGPSEQRAISDYLDLETIELDAAIADAREAVALSRERRAALISAAVTGKIDVRERGAVA